jgi:peptide subunit release factor 1 (eRF1)
MLAFGISAKCGHYGARIVREDHVSHVILAGDSVVIPLLQEQLPQEMVSVVEVMKLDIHPSEQDVLTATLAKLQEQEAKTAGEKVDRLMQQYRSRGLAVVGLQETLEALANGQVEELLIIGALEASHPQPEEVQAILAPEIRDSKGGTESEEPRQASMPDLLVTKAKQTGATVTFIEDAALLQSAGGVAAFLRWRAQIGNWFADQEACPRSLTLAATISPMTTSRSPRNVKNPFMTLLTCATQSPASRRCKE